MNRNRLYLIFADLLAFYFAHTCGGLVFWGVRRLENFWQLHWNWAGIYLVVVPLGIVWFYLKGHYTRRWPFWDELRDICQILAILAIVDGALVFLAKSSFSRIWFATSFTSLFLFLPLFRAVAIKLLRRAGMWSLPTVIIGAGANAADVMMALAGERRMGFELKGLWTFDPPSEPAIMGVPVRQVREDLEQRLNEEGVSCVIVAPDGEGWNGTGALLERLQRHTRDLYVVPAVRGIPLYGMELHYFFRHEVIMMRVRNNLLRPVVRVSKRGLDLFGALLLAVFFSPLLLMVSLLICRDGGPVLYGHTRVGFQGRSFKCWKFRSMVTNAEELLSEILDRDPQARAEWESDFKLKDDPRITRIGRFLRKSSLDELPQLWNVLKGEMSLVGPRPLVEEELSRYGDQVDYYLQVRPGMTGLWQVSGRNDVDYTHRVYLDVWYVKNWSLWYDIAILFKTLKVVFGRHGAY